LRQVKLTKGKQNIKSSPPQKGGLFLLAYFFKFRIEMKKKTAALKRKSITKRAAAKKKAPIRKSIRKPKLEKPVNPSDLTHLREDVAINPNDVTHS
jgi:hypothetical protein